MTDSMKRAIGETDRRRKIQGKFNKEHGIRPVTIIKEIREGIEKWKSAEEYVAEVVGEPKAEYELKSYLAHLKRRMEAAARALEFDKAARYRDEIRRIEEREKVGESILKPRKA